MLIQLTLCTASQCMPNMEEEAVALEPGHLDSYPKLTHSKTKLLLPFVYKVETPSEVPSERSGVGVRSLENEVGGRTGEV